MFEWLALSDLTSCMLGPPVFPDNPVPTWEEFEADYADYFFEGQKNASARSFIILKDAIEIGHISYGTVSTSPSTAELDIWLAQRSFAGSGTGPAAIRMLCEYLFGTCGFSQIMIQPSARNRHAVRAYKKAGFLENPEATFGLIPDYYDSVFLTLRKDEHR